MLSTVEIVGQGSDLDLTCISCLVFRHLFGSTKTSTALGISGKGMPSDVYTKLQIVPLMIHTFNLEAILFGAQTGKCICSYRKIIVDKNMEQCIELVFR